MTRILIPLSIGAGTLIMGVLVWTLLLSPATRRLAENIDRVQTQVLPELDRRIGDLASQHDADDLVKLWRQGQKTLVEVRRMLADVDRRMNEWFPQLGAVAVGELPKRDEFKSRYAFAEDQLRRDIRALVAKVPEARGVPAWVETIPLRVPAFEKEDRLPKGAELPTSQRIFNIQNMVFLAAAAEGAMPCAEPEIVLDWNRPSGPRGDFVEDRVTAAFLVPSGRVPRLLRALVGLQGEGPFSRLAGLETRRVEIPADLGEDLVPPIRVEVQLLLTFYRPEKKRS